MILNIATSLLLKRCLSAGAEAYLGASYGIAMAHFKLGRVLKTRGTAEEALAPLAESQQRFQALADAAHADAAHMASTVIVESAECLSVLGRYEEAAAAYDEGIRRSEKLGNRRQAAVGNGNLGTVRMLQKRYAEALERYAEALKTFDSLGEPGSVAAVWHQIGMLHRRAEQFEQAEQAYRQSLAICVQYKLRADEAGSLGELGTLYKQMGWLEEAVTFQRQAAEIYAKLPDLRNEGLARGNLADTLIKLQRYDEARRELLRAIECKKTFGHAAYPWATWYILHNLEQVAGNTQAAAEARGQAVASYLAYRRAGGQSMDWGAQCCAAVAQAIARRETAGLAQELAEFLTANDAPRVRALLHKLQAILRGDRAPALADDQDLLFADAVELRLLLERLGAK